MPVEKLSELAFDLFEKKEFKKAKSLYLEIIEFKIGTDINRYERDFILRIYENLIECCEEIGEYSEMENWAEIAFNYYNTEIVEPDLGYFDRLFSICIAKKNTNKLREAESKLRLGIKKMKGLSNKIIGPNLRFYMTLGDLFSDRDDHALGLHYYKKAIRIAKGIDFLDSSMSEILNNNIGNIYLYLNNFDLAIRHLNIALDYIKSGTDVPLKRILGTEQNLAIVYALQNDNQKSVDQFKAMLLKYEDRLKNAPQGVAAIRQNLGMCYLRLNDIENAEKYLMLAWETKKDLPKASFPRLNIQNCLADLATAKGEFEKCVEIHLNNQQNILLSSNNGNRETDLKGLKPTLILCNSYWGELNGRLQHLKSKKNSSKEDWYLFEKRFFIVDQVLAQLPREATSGKTRANWKQVTHQILQVVLEFTIEFQKKFDDDRYVNSSFGFFTRFNGAISIYDMRAADVNQSDPLILELINQEKEFNKEIKKLELEIAQSQQTNNSEKEKKSQLEEDLFQVQESYKFFLDETKKHFPDFYHLRYKVEELDIKKFQSCLSKDSLALFYVWSISKVFLFVVPKVGKVELHFLGLVKELKDELSNFHQSFNLLIRSKLNKSAEILGSTLLKPIITRKDLNQNNLLIFPGGELLKVPFESFRIKRKEKEEVKERFLVESYNIQYHVWPQLWVKRALAKKTKEKKEVELFFGISPTYSSIPAAKARSLVPQFRSVINKKGEVANLPFTIKEIKELQYLLESNKREVLLFESEKANPNYIKTEIHRLQPDIIHFASHGILNRKNPELSGLLLSTVYNAEGDVFDNLKRNTLYSNEIYNWKLKTKLVVLSCCDTGIGELVRGEGLMAINKAFLYAGAESVLFSLGKVLDKPTKELMLLFYSFLMEGCETWEALQKAKRIMLKEGKPPKYWASFILV